ncbi:MAG: excisionase family DNA-binding protein [Thermoanaerobacteraceae bacterium]|nr:excisionase family DNA-binding protein [Thermoanaerobacteraceae bacterium]
MAQKTENLRYEDLPDFLTVKELKEYLRVGWNKAYQIANEIPHYRSGNRRLFPKEKVKEWALKQSRTKIEKRLWAVK